MKTAIRIISKILPEQFKNFLKKFRKFNAINNLDKQLLEYLNIKNGFYIECGANDGVNQSNTWYFETNLNWKGILIEPNVKSFNKLINNRSSKNIFENVALVSESLKKKKKKIYLIDNGLTSKITDINNASNIKEVAIETLSNILIKHKINNINLFSLDVEGYEKEVLEGVNLNIFNIDYILIETNYFDQINIILKNYNYIFIKKLGFNDYLFKKVKIK
jgi:FkbM family methyltransferase